MVAASAAAIPTVLSVTMAGIDILCTDTTGALTQNKLTQGDPFSPGWASESKWLPVMRR